MNSVTVKGAANSYINVCTICFLVETLYPCINLATYGIVLCRDSEKNFKISCKICPPLQCILGYISALFDILLLVRLSDTLADSAFIRITSTFKLGTQILHAQNDVRIYPRGKS